MTITTLLPETWKEDKVKIEDAISELKKSKKEANKARKADWKTVKLNFRTEMKGMEKSLKELKSLRKK